MSDTLIHTTTEETFLQETTDEILVQEISHQEILSEGIMGPPGPAGPQGPPGPPGIGTSSPWQESVFTLGGDQTVFVLPATPAPATVSLYTNGLRETSDNFTVLGAVITITGFTPTAGDVISFTFQ